MSRLEKLLDQPLTLFHALMFYFAHSVLTSEITAAYIAALMS